MGSMYKGLFQGRLLPQLSLIRNKHKHNITKPRLPHFERHVVEHVCNPYFLKKKTPQYLPNIDSCSAQTEVKRKHLMHPLLDILAKEALAKIKSSKFIGFFHLNSFDSEEVFQFQVMLKKNGMKFTYFKKIVMVKALTGTDYEPVLQLYKGPTVMATSAELQLTNLLKISKKPGKFSLMAALVEDRLLSYSELKFYGQYENLDTARVQLVHTLNLPSQYFVQQINQNPNTLVQCLNQRIENLKKHTNTSAS